MPPLSEGPQNKHGNLCIECPMCPGSVISVTMVKQRMSTADVAGEVACLRHSVLGMRVANVYDVNSKVSL